MKISEPVRSMLVLAGLALVARKGRAARLERWQPRRVLDRVAEADAR